MGSNVLAHVTVTSEADLDAAIAAARNRQQRRLGNVSWGGRIVQSVQEFPDFMDANPLDSERTSWFLWVDKSHMIRRILDLTSPQVLLRPRRSGKTLTVQMIQYFLEYDLETRDARLAALQLREANILKPIGNWKYEDHFASYPVVHLVMAAFTFDDPTSLRTALYLIIQEEIRRQYQLHQFSHLQKAHTTLYRALQYWCGSSDWRPDDCGIDLSLQMLLKALYHQFHKKKPVLLIDRYDYPFLRPVDPSHKNTVAQILTTFFAAALNHGNYVGKCLLTGVHRLDWSATDSNLNNIREAPLHIRSELADVGMLTSKEVEDIYMACSAWGKEKKASFRMQDLQSWFDGYKGWVSHDDPKYGEYSNRELRLYNPVSILGSFQDGVVGPHWVKTSSRDTSIRALLQKGSPELRRKLLELSKGETCSVWYGRDSNHTILGNEKLSERDKDKIIWALLIDYGYLAVSSEAINAHVLDVRVPNYEMSSYVWKGWIRDMFPQTC